MRRTIPGTLRRFVLGLAALLLLAAAVHWIISQPVVRFSLGKASALVAAPGVPSFAVREDGDLWRLYGTSARKREDGQPLPGPVLGLPALQADGSVFVLTAEGLRWMHGSQPLVPGGEVLLVIGHDLLPAGCRLEGVIGGSLPLLSAPLSAAAGPNGPRKLLLCEGAPKTPELRDVFDTESEAQLPADAPLVLSRGSLALAFPGAHGWEAWSLETPHLARRVVAEGCTRPGAVFLPDGHALVVPGHTDGLWLLSLKDGRLDLMAEGNPGVSRRVEHRVGFRTQPPLMVAPGWGIDGWLQIFQTHLSGGGRTAFGSGFMHHYGVDLSTDGNLMVYAQASFDEKSDEPFEEQLYLFDFATHSEAVQLDSRQGGLTAQGPYFVGDSGSLVYIAHGEAMRTEVLPRSVREGSP
jgi:hypothetical protein